MTTIILADDHEIVRQGLRTLLEVEPNFQIIGEAGNGLETARLVERLQPDVLVVDVMMPGLNGLEVTRQVSERSPHTRVVILSMRANEAYVLEALRNGAAGYVLKADSTAELVHAVREVAAGRRYLSPPLSERALEAYVQKAKQVAPEPHSSLTTREREVLHLAAEGHTNAEIAVQLSISAHTAMTHRANVMRKLGLHNQADLIRYAMQRGILPLED
jgi:two-component system, NarL family, response regulator NreC